ncbi:MAG: MmgE/PrpD family protein [Burkholderiales bacterium]|nr:MmgE/PrpD family protein [Burkholderiales bacterium]
MTRSPTARLARLIADAATAAPTAETRHAAKRHFMDTLGAIVAGASQAPARLAAGVHAELQPPGPVVVPGQPRGFDALTAAFLMGTAAHGLELDDGFTPGSVHPGVAVVPALVAAMQHHPVSGARLVAATIVGYELVARLARGIHPVSRRRGFHNTGVVGPLAAAGAVGTLIGFDAARATHVLGLAASSAAGLFAFLHGGGDVKRLHAGHAAREGLLAALLAERGMTGPAAVLESRDGFLQAFGDPEHSSLLAEDEPTERAITACYIKPWACCRHVHPALDALFALRTEHGLEGGNVRRLEVETYAIGAAHRDTGWNDMLSAQMSYPFAMAVALVRGHADLADFDEASRADPEVLAACRKVEVRVDPAFDAAYPRSRLARVTITTTDGRRLASTVDEGYGGPAAPISDDALARKFDGLVAPVLGAGRARALREAIAALDDAPDTSALATLLR